MRKRRKRGGVALIENQAVYIHYYNRLLELAVSMFEWVNMPDSIDPRFLEYTLITEGCALFFKDDVMEKYLALQTTLGGPIGFYRIPDIRRAYSDSGYHNKLDKSNSVIIFNNMLHTNGLPDIEIYATKLYECDRTMMVNVKAQKTPVLIKCTENQRLTMINLYAQYDGNEPFLFGDKSLDIDDIKAFSTTAPYVCDKLQELKGKIWNEALTHLGISNLDLNKKERLVTDEVNVNQGGTLASRYSRLAMRQEACRQINEMFGLNVGVKYRNDLSDIEGIYKMEEGNNE